MPVIVPQFIRLKSAYRSLGAAFNRLWAELSGPELGKGPFAVALACCVLSIGIGLGYAQTIDVTGWQLLTWAVCILTAVVVLTPRFTLRPDRSWVWLGALLAAALALRLPWLDSIPGGLHVDEMGVADFALRHVYFSPTLTINPFFTGPSSQPILFHYLIRLTLDLFGHNIVALRSSSAIAGSLAVLATYAAVAVLQNRRVALFSAVIMAAFHFHIQWSRLALNNIWDTVWIPLMVAGFAWGWKKGHGGGAVLAGLALGLSQYFYAGSKIGIFLMAFLIFSLWRQQTPMVSKRAYLARFLLITVCVAAPIACFALFNWKTYMDRPLETWGWSEISIRVVMGDVYGWVDYARYFWFQVSHALGAFFVYADVTGFYGPGVPFLIGYSAVLFMIGCLGAIYKRIWLPVLWILLVAFFGGVLLNGNPSSSHFVASIPAICWLVALPISWVAERGRGRLAVLLVVIVVLTDLIFYFGIYAASHPRDLINAFPPFP